MQGSEWKQMIKTEKYLEVTGLLLLFLQPNLCSKAYSSLNLLLLHSLTSVSESSLRLLLGRLCISTDGSSLLPWPGWGISSVFRSGDETLEIPVPSLAGFMHRVPVLPCTLLSSVPILYSRGPAWQDVAAGCGKTPYSNRGLGSPLLRPVPRYRGGDRGTTLLWWFSGTWKAFNREVEK